MSNPKKSFGKQICKYVYNYCFIQGHLCKDYAYVSDAIQYLTMGMGSLSTIRLQIFSNNICTNFQRMLNSKALVSLMKYQAIKQQQWQAFSWGHQALP